jgi:hypothetical protein
MEERKKAPPKFRLAKFFDVEDHEKDKPEHEARTDRAVHFFENFDHRKLPTRRSLSLGALAAQSLTVTISDIQDPVLAEIIPAFRQGQSQSFMRACKEFILNGKGGASSSPQVH